MIGLLKSAVHFIPYERHTQSALDFPAFPIPFSCSALIAARFYEKRPRSMLFSQFIHFLESLSPSE
jgi:hypothetical protein